MKIACITPDGKHDYLVEMVLEGLQENRVDLVISDPGNGVSDIRLPDQKFVQKANECDAVIAFFGKARNNSPPRHYLLNSITLPKDKKVYVDGSEWTCTGWEGPTQAKDSLVDPSKRRGEPWINELMFEKCGHYFKRETYPQDLSRGIIPLPFALCERHIDLNAENVIKDIDVFCSFGHTKTGLRKEINNAISIFQQINPSLNIVTTNNLSKQDYKKHLLRSKIIIDAFGGGDTCDRFFEGIGAHACVLYQKYNVVIPNAFTDNHNAVSFEYIDEMIMKLNELTENPYLAIGIGRAGFLHAKTYHTSAHRAREIINRVFA